MVNVDSLCSQFAPTAGAAPPSVWARAPGRVCLLGEHTDYNDGLVLPAAIAPSVHVAGRRRSDCHLTVHSMQMNQRVSVSLGDVRGTRSGSRPFVPPWTNYVYGVAVLLARRGIALPAADLLIDSDLPIGGGVSSSAALEVAAAQALLALANTSLDDVELALLAREAEHEFARSPCGILDQFASVLSQAEHVLLLDCRSQQFEHIPFAFDSCVIAVLDSRTHHELGRSEYPVRQAQCRAAVDALRQFDGGVQALRDASLELLERHEAALDTSVYRRSRHVVTENERVRQGAAALRRGDAVGFGRLMTQSHSSLRHDYQVSCPELDALVEISTSIDGVYGAKMSGGGFGGCVVALLEAQAAGPLRSALCARYDTCFPDPAGVLLTRPGAGTEVHRL